jgi:hypothetical protein
MAGFFLYKKELFKIFLNLTDHIVKFSKKTQQKISVKKNGSMSNGIMEKKTKHLYIKVIKSSSKRKKASSLLIADAIELGNKKRLSAQN